MASSKYEKFINNGGLVLAEGWARDGLTDNEIAHNIGISRSTLNEWRKKYPEFEKAVRYGKEYANVILENALFKAAVGYDTVETMVEKDEFGESKERTVKRYIAPNVTAAIFLAKNRMPNKYKDKHDTKIDLQSDGKSTGVVILPEIKEGAAE